MSTASSDISASPELHPACCKVPPVRSTYTPRGSVGSVPGSPLASYSVGAADAKHAVVIIYDIFGFHNATKQTADLLSDALHGRVVMPDLFEGTPWPLSNFPPQNPAELGEWINTRGSPDIIVPYLRGVVAQLRLSHNFVSVVGFCWGAKLAAIASSISDSENRNFIDSAALVHPYSVTAEDARGTRVPWCILPSKDEPDMSDVYEALKKDAPCKESHMMKRFDDMHHGWCAARADFNNETNRIRTHEAICEIVSFVQRATRLRNSDNTQHISS